MPGGTDDIGLNAAGLERPVLEDDSALAACRRDIEFGEVLAVVQHTARQRCLEAEQQPQQRRLAAARCPDHGDELSRLRGEAAVVENERAVLPVPEGQVGHRDPAGEVARIGLVKIFITIFCYISGVMGVVTAVLNAGQQPTRTTAAVVAGVIGAVLLLAGIALSRRPRL